MFTLKSGEITFHIKDDYKSVSVSFNEVFGITYQDRIGFPLENTLIDLITNAIYVGDEYNTVYPIIRQDQLKYNLNGMYLTSHQIHSKVSKYMSENKITILHDNSILNTIIKNGEVVFKYPTELEKFA